LLGLKAIGYKRAQLLNIEENFFLNNLFAPTCHAATER
jgi:hypothetical protein